LAPTKTKTSSFFLSLDEVNNRIKSKTEEMNNKMKRSMESVEKGTQSFMISARNVTSSLLLGERTASFIRRSASNGFGGGGTFGGGVGKNSSSSTSTLVLSTSTDKTGPRTINNSITTTGTTITITPMKPDSLETEEAFFTPRSEASVNSYNAIVDELNFDTASESGWPIEEEEEEENEEEDRTLSPLQPELLLASTVTTADGGGKTILRLRPSLVGDAWGRPSDSSTAIDTTSNTDSSDSSTAENNFHSNHSTATTNSTSIGFRFVNKVSVGQVSEEKLLLLESHNINESNSTINSSLKFNANNLNSSSLEIILRDSGLIHKDTEFLYLDLLGSGKDPKHYYACKLRLLSSNFSFVCEGQTFLSRMTLTAAISTLGGVLSGGCSPSCITITNTTGGGEVRVRIDNFFFDNDFESPSAGQSQVDYLVRMLVKTRMGAYTSSSSGSESEDPDRVNFLVPLVRFVMRSSSSNSNRIGGNKSDSTSGTKLKQTTLNALLEAGHRVIDFV